MPEFDSAYRVIRRRGEQDVRSLDSYRRLGGYSALEKAVREQTPEQVVQEVLDATLRGRGALCVVRMTPSNTLFATLTMPTYVRGLLVPCWSAILTRSSKALC